VLDEHLALADLRQGAEGRTGTRKGAQELGQERLFGVRHRLGRGEALDERVEGAVDGRAFEAYVERFLAPELERGQIVLMDNLSVHKAGWVRDLIEDKGCQLWLLPPYSPDLKWDEKAEAGAPCGSYDGVMSVRSPRKEGHDHPAQRHRRYRSR
jgi:DDE superfamily endonuclease